MATKAQAKKVEVAPQEIIETVETAVKAEPVKAVKPSWEIKDRTYILKGHFTPLTYTIKSKHSARFPMLWFDEELGEQKELRYATNQNSPFTQEQKGEATLGHIVFKNGTLTVPKSKQNLQKLLSLYHPDLSNKYFEFSKVEEAGNDLDYLNLEIDALNASRSMDIDQAEAILRAELGSQVSTMSSRELKRDLILFARRNPVLFMELANDDNVILRNFAIKANEAGIIVLAPDQRTFKWGSNGRKLMTVPFDEHPYSAMAAFFKTDEGLEIYRSIEKKFS
jgi:hypothetical protein